MDTINQTLFTAINASEHPSAMLVFFAKVVAEWLVYAPMLIVLGLWVRGRPRQRPALLAVLAGLLVAMAANGFAHALWYTPRPFAIGWGHTLLAHDADSSFPSDHATFIWALGFGLIATRAAPVIGGTFCVLGIAIAWARVYLGLHFPFDMVGSLVIAIAGAMTAWGLTGFITQRVARPVSWLYHRILEKLRLPAAIFPRDHT